MLVLRSQTLERAAGPSNPSYAPGMALRVAQNGVPSWLGMVPGASDMACESKLLCVELLVEYLLTNSSRMYTCSRIIGGASWFVLCGCEG